MQAGAWIVFLAYSAAVVGLGFWARRRKKDRELETKGLEFWMANRELPGWRLAISLTSGWLMLGWIGFGMSQIYMYGATGLWILPIPWLVLCVLVIFLVPHVRRIRAVSLPQGIEQRFGSRVRILVAILSVGVFTAWTGAELFMAGNLLEGFLGIPPWAVMVLFVLPIAAYTVLGSFRAIVTTDILQFGLMVVFMLVLVASAVSRASDASGGDILGALSRSAPPWGGEGVAGSLGVLGWLFPIVLLVGYLPGWAIEQDLWLRIQSAPSTREARKGAILALFSIGIFVIAIPSVVAFSALVVFPPDAGGASPAVGANAIGIISAFVSGMSPAVALLMLLGIVACQMSTVDTFANVTAMPLCYDLVEPMLLAKRKRSRAEVTLFAQGISALALALGLGYALVADSLNDVYYLSSGVLSACIAIPTAAMFWRRANGVGALAASLAGFVGTVGVYLYEYHWLQALDLAAPRYYSDVLPGILAGAYGYLYVGSGVVLGAAVLVIVSLLTSPADSRRRAAVHAAPVDGGQALESISEGNYAGGPAGQGD